VFINPRFTGFDSDDFGFIPTLARMNRLKHLKLPAALYAPTDIDSQLPGPAGIVQVGRSDDKKISIKQVRHSRPRRFQPGPIRSRPEKISAERLYNIFAAEKRAPGQRVALL
jgi:hypothetical protein